MNEIYVIGHHNPDTDSIVSAMAYAALRNALGDRNYVAAHMDHISDQTQRMLDRFGFQPPRTVQNVRTQVEDLDYDTPPALNATVTMDRAWHIMREQVAAGLKKENDVCESRLQSPSRTDRLNIEVRNVYHPLQREELLR